MSVFIKPFRLKHRENPQPPYKYTCITPQVTISPVNPLKKSAEFPVTPSKNTIVYVIKMPLFAKKEKNLEK